VRITVLGKSPAWQDVDGACSGYLVEAGDHCVLLDCGNGVFGKLRARRDYCDVDAVVLSHLHADHFFDLIPFSYGLIYAPRQQPVPVHLWPGTDTPARPDLHVPPGAREAFSRVTATLGNDKLVEQAFKVREYDPAETIEIGPFSVRFHHVPHFAPTWAVEFATDGKRFTFGADSSPSDELVEFARDTDLLMIEATLPRPEREGPRGHLTPEEAGQHARRAGAKRVVITHFSDELEADWVAAEACRGFGDVALVAEEGAVYEV
jgi:ribonuclease BN (tRNA processing enzyme)